MVRPERVVVAAFIGWKIVGTFLLGLSVGPFVTSWEGAYFRLHMEDPLRAFYNWDGHHYLRIARQGFSDPEDRVFYPLFPLLIRTVTTVCTNEVVAGLVATAVCSVLFALVYRRFALRALAAHDAALPLLFLIASPIALYLNCVYTEALFLLLLFLFFQCFFERSWIAGLFAVLLTITRGQGLFVGFAVALVLAGEAPGIWRRGDWPRAVYLIGIGGCFVVGLAGFLTFEYFRFGNPLEFMDAQALVYSNIAGFSLANSFRPSHVIWLLTSIPADLNGPTNGLIDRLYMYAGIALAPLVWRWDRRLFAFYFCLAYFPATMGYGGSYSRYFLLPYSIAAIALARAYVDRRTILGVSKVRVATIAIGLGFALQAMFSLLYAGSRWIG